MPWFFCAACGRSGALNNAPPQTPDPLPSNGDEEEFPSGGEEDKNDAETTIPEEKDDLVTYGTQIYRGFLLDNVYHSPSDGASTSTFPKTTREASLVVMGIAPELFTAYLHCSAQWDADLNVLAEAKTPAVNTNRQGARRAHFTSD